MLMLSLGDRVEKLRIGKLDAVSTVPKRYYVSFCGEDGLAGSATVSTDDVAEFARLMNAVVMLMENVEKHGLPTVEVPLREVGVGEVRKFDEDGHPVVKLKMASCVGESAPEIEDYKLAQRQWAEKDEMC